jgi:hypothetical protein
MLYRESITSKQSCHLTLLEAGNYFSLWLEPNHASEAVIEDLK